MCRVNYLLDDKVFPKHWLDKSHKTNSPMCPGSGTTPQLPDASLQLPEPDSVPSVVPSEEEKRALLHEALGHDVTELLFSLERFKGRDGYPDAIFQLAKIPDYFHDLNASVAACDSVADRFDVIIRRHNNGQWQVELCEPSHEVSACDESLPRAIAEAVSKTLKLWT